MSSELRKNVLNRIQRNFPLVAEPYKALAAELGCTQAELLSCLQTLKDEGVIRQISPIFESRKLGYTSTLVAVEVDAESVAAVAAKIGELHFVTHNYGREHRFNLWFTMIVPAQEVIDHVLAKVRKLPGVKKVLDLPAIGFYKIKVEFKA